MLGRIQRRVGRLPKGLQAHIYRVMDIAEELAQRHGIDPQRASLGMLAHDVARAMSVDELIRRATELGLPIGVVESRVPILLHGPVERKSSAARTVCKMTCCTGRYTGTPPVIHRWMRWASWCFWPTSWTRKRSAIIPISPS